LYTYDTRLNNLGDCYPTLKLWVEESPNTINKDSW